MRYSFFGVEAGEVLESDKLTVEEVSALCFANICVCSVKKRHRRGGKMLSRFCYHCLSRALGFRAFLFTLQKSMQSLQDSRRPSCGWPRSREQTIQGKSCG